MGLSNFKKVLLVLLFIWIGTLCYIWLPGIIPDVLHLRSPSEQANKLKGGLGVDRVPGLQHTDSQSHTGLHNLSQLEDSGLLRDTDKGVHVVITSDNNTMGGMVALIHSIVSNTKTPVFFHLITDQPSRKHLQTWLMQTKLRSINYEIKEFPLHWVEGKITVRGGRPELANPLNYARYYLPRLLPHIDGRVIYIDDDSIVQGDITELYHMKLKPGTLAAFSEDCLGINKRITFMQNTYADYFDLKNKHFKELNIDPKACAFNTGVFVTNLTAWRQHNITEQLEYWLQLNTREELYGNEKGGGGSQPPMMLVFYKKYTAIDQMWHVHYLGWSPRSSYSQQYIRSAKLLHWNGRFKPWGRTSSYQEIWNGYYLSDPTQQFRPVRRGIV